MQFDGLRDSANWLAFPMRQCHTKLYSPSSPLPSSIVDSLEPKAVSSFKQTYWAWRLSCPDAGSRNSPLRLCGLVTRPSNTWSQRCPRVDVPKEDRQPVSAPDMCRTLFKLHTGHHIPCWFMYMDRIDAAGVAARQGGR